MELDDLILEIGDTFSYFKMDLCVLSKKTYLNTYIVYMVKNGTIISIFDGTFLSIKKSVLLIEKKYR
jgi:hypothetical protein